MGQAEMHLLDKQEWEDVPDWNEDNPIAVITRTTLSVNETRRAITEVEETFSDVIVRNDLCYATTNRQAAVEELTEIVDVVLVVGAHNSSNCNRLREVAQAIGRPAYLINGPEELDFQWLDGYENIGITSGASTPESLMMDVISALAPDEVTTVGGAEEEITFVLPHDLRQ